MQNITTHQIHKFISQVCDMKGFDACNITHPQVVTENTVMTIHFPGHEEFPVSGTFDQLKHIFDVY